MAYLSSLLDNFYYLATLSVAMALLISFRLYPMIIYVVNQKGLMDDPKERSSHSTRTPTLGGMGLFISFSITLMLLSVAISLSRPELIQLVALLPALIILLFMGIKDDLILMSPRKKLMGQFIASGIVIFMTDIRITHFEGILGIGELPYLVSVLFTLFVSLLVINALNLIDGIDGLAGSIGIIASTVFGIAFMLAENYLMALISFTLIGSIIGYLYYNLSNTQKLFMGDSGSMLLGFLLVYQGIAFLGVNLDTTAAYTILNAPVLLLALLSYPLFDTLRVFILRVLQKRSPFSADRNHIHHYLLNLGLAHEQITLVICLGTLLLSLLVFLMGGLNNNVQLLISVFFGSALYLLPTVLSAKLGTPRSKEDKSDKAHLLPKEKMKSILGRPMLFTEIKEKNGVTADLKISYASKDLLKKHRIKVHRPHQITTEKAN